MKFRTIISLIFIIVILITSLLSADDRLSDPYEIMNRNYEAVGGLDKLKAVTGSYFLGNISIQGGALSGTIKQWNRSPLFQRVELDLKVFHQTTGDNGQYRWVVDANGKLNISHDLPTIKRRRVDSLIAEYEQLNPDSKYFNISLDGMAEVNGRECYAIRTSNVISEDTVVEFIDAVNFLILKRTDIRPDETTHDLYSDYRSIDGLMFPMRHDMEILPVGQKMIIEITEYELNPEIDPSIYEPPQENASDFYFTEGIEVENVPFVYSQEHILIPVTINCKERYWILDSGAGMSVIDSAFAASIGLNSEGGMKGRGIGNTVDVYFVKIPEYNLQGLYMNSQTVASINLADLLERADWDAAGILGYDFLSRFVTKIDYANCLISFYDPEYFEYDGSGVIIDATMQGNFLTLPMSIEGEYTGRWNLDTGAGSTSLHYPFASQHGFTERKGIERESFGAGGSLREKTTQVSEFEIGGFKLNNQLLDFPTEEGVGAFSGQQLIGNLGNTLFRNFVMYLDYSKQQVILEKGDNFGRKFPRGGSGMQVLVDDGGYLIHFVSPGTPAEKSGFKNGDKIISINGIDCKHLDGLEAVRDLLQAEPKTKYEFEIVRVGKKMNLKLVLADLY